jgi:hypothetical protein
LLIVFRENELVPHASEHRADGAVTGLQEHLSVRLSYRMELNGLFRILCLNLSRLSMSLAWSRAV